jgi:hypothetical protein
VVLFPCTPVSFLLTDRVGVFQLLHPLSNVFHLLSALIFFASLIYTNLFLFTKSSGDVTPNKAKRNHIYRASGYLMTLGLLIVIASSLFNLPLTMLGEIIMLFFYGVAWFVKGETLLKD